MHRTLKRLDAAHEKLLATVTPLAPGVFSRPPSATEWSVAEIVHHLRLVEDRVIKELEKQLANPPHKLGLLRRLVPIAIVGSRLIKVKAPQAMNPVEAPDKEISIASYNATRNKLKELWANSGPERLKQVVFRHPFLGNINGVATVSFVGYHEQRHLKQIREVLGKLK